MTSTPSYYKKGAGLNFYLWTLKKHIGITAIMSAIMIIFMPANIFLNALSYVLNKAPLQEYTDEFGNTLSGYPMFGSYLFGQILMIVTIIIFVIVLSSMIFNYMNNKQSVDAFHSLPLSRPVLFMSKYFAGLTLLLIPTIVVLGITFAIKVLMNLNDITNLQFAKFTFTLIMLEIACYTFSVFITVNTGTIFDSILSLITINIAWPLMLLVTNALFGIMLYGYTSNIGFEMYFLLSPFIRIVISFISPSLGSVIWWLVFIVVLFAASILLYSRRKSEAAGLPFAFPPLKIIIKVVVSALSGIMLGFIFIAILNNIIAFFAGFILGSFIAYTIVELIISRGFKKYAKSLITYAVIAAAFGLFYCIISTGGLGFETRVPKTDNVQGVRIYGQALSANDPNSLTSYSSYDNILLTDEQSIYLVNQLHNNIAKDVGEIRKKTLFQPASYYIGDEDYETPYAAYGLFSSMFSSLNDITIEYHMNNGNIIKRTYNIQDNPYSEIISDINLQKDYQSNQNTAKQMQNAYYDQMFYYDSNGFDSYNIDITKEEYDRLNNAFQTDLTEQFAKDSTVDYQTPIATITLRSDELNKTNKNPFNIFLFGSYSANDITILVYPGYSNVLSFLEQKGMISSQRTDPSLDGTYEILESDLILISPDVQKASTTGYILGAKFEPFLYDFDIEPDRLEELQADSGTVKSAYITDKTQINEILSSAVKIDIYDFYNDPFSNQTDFSGYSYVFTYVNENNYDDNRYLELYLIPEENTPEFLNDIEYSYHTYKNFRDTFITTHVVV